MKKIVMDFKEYESIENKIDNLEYKIGVYSECLKFENRIFDSPDPRCPVYQKYICVINKEKIKEHFRVDEVIIKESE